VLAGWRIQGDVRGHSADEARGSTNERLVKVSHWHQPTTGPKRSTERQLGAFCQSCDGDSFSARTICNRDAERQWLAGEAFLAFDSEMCRRTQWFDSPKAVDQFPHRVGESQQRNSDYPDNRRDDLWCQ
jgi:hypothetical protein